MVLAQITNVEILLKQNYAATLYKNAIFFLPLNALICGKNYQQRVDNHKSNIVLFAYTKSWLIAHSVGSLLTVMSASVAVTVMMDWKVPWF